MYFTVARSPYANEKHMPYEPKPNSVYPFRRLLPNYVYPVMRQLSNYVLPVRRLLPNYIYIYILLDDCCLIMYVEHDYTDIYIYIYELAIDVK